MKNFQQTPRAKRIAMSGNKAALALSKPKNFQPREAWSTKRKINGVAQSVLNDKQHTSERWIWREVLFSW